MDPKRIPIVQEMILADSEEDRKLALDKLLPIQQEDFEGIFEAMQGHPVTIRLLDPPLHEFLPDKEELLVEVTKLQMTAPDSAELKEKELLLKKVNQLAESEPNVRSSWLSIRTLYILRFMKCKQELFSMLSLH